MAHNWLNQRFADRQDCPKLRNSGLTASYHLWRKKKLLEITKWASERSPFYRPIIGPDIIEELAGNLRRLAADELWRALAPLPLTCSEDLAADSLAFLAVGQDDVEGIVTVPTSGTSGQAKRVFSTAADLEETIAFFEYGMRVLVSPGRDRVALAMSPARAGNVADLLGRALGRWQIPFAAFGFAPTGKNEESRWLEELANWKPSSLVGVPSQMLAISRHEKARLLKGLRSLLLSGDVAEDGLVSELEKNLPNCRVYRHYGLTECGLGGAVECERRDWPHLRDDLWVEIIDQNGEALPPGKSGEIVVTSLTRRALPLLRYRTGDEGLIIGESCACQTLSPRLKIFGRLSEFVFNNGAVTIRTTDFEAPLLKLSFVRDYDLVLKAGGQLEIIITPTAESPRRAGELLASQIGGWLRSQGAELPFLVKIKNSAESIKIPSRGLGGKRRLTRE